MTFDVMFLLIALVACTISGCFALAAGNARDEAATSAESAEKSRASAEQLERHAAAMRSAADKSLQTILTMIQAPGVRERIATAIAAEQAAE